ncbi:MAG: hypothetical protein PHH12_01035 [Candidatus Shapirobacteria bacterium]|jgi:hypothetical protein|nr:hypothetical protein [Candidatus Shapirobacteria bacterium]
MAENKERLIIDETKEVIKEREEKQSGEMIDLEKNREVVIPREVKNWMEKVEEDPSLNNQGQNNGNDDSALQSIATTVTKISLPTNKRVFSEGFGKTVGDAGRWLSEFVFRLIKKNKGNVKFNEE